MIDYSNFETRALVSARRGGACLRHDVRFRKLLAQEFNLLV